MMISELIEMLQDAQDRLGNVEVRLATQSNWPMEYTLGEGAAEVDGIFYLAESDQVGYLSVEAAKQLAWSA